MAVKYKDYFEILGVSRTASQDEIKTAYRNLAKKYHPDVNKAKDAEERFKEIGEAYEVLRDPDKRKKYEQLGSNWRGGEDFTPPPGWQSPSGGAGASDFSDFFESLFGGSFGGSVGGFHSRGFGRQRRTRDIPGEDVEVRVSIPLEDAFHGAERVISLRDASDGDGHIRNLRVKIPKGVTNGQRIRLSGQGGPGQGQGEPGDLYMIVELETHPRYRVGGRDLFVDLPIAPWEAALGAEITFSTLAGDVTLTVPPGSSSGQKLRLRGKGLPNPSGAAGDLYAETRIVTPKSLTKKQRAAWQALATESEGFKPREE